MPPAVTRRGPADGSAHPVDPGPQAYTPVPLAVNSQPPAKTLCAKSVPLMRVRTILPLAALTRWVALGVFEVSYVPAVRPPPPSIVGLPMTALGRPVSHRSLPSEGLRSWTEPRYALPPIVTPGPPK